MALVPGTKIGKNRSVIGDKRSSISIPFSKFGTKGLELTKQSDKWVEYIFLRANKDDAVFEISGHRGARPEFFTMAQLDDEDGADNTSSLNQFVAATNNPDKGIFSAQLKYDEPSFMKLLVMKVSHPTDDLEVRFEIGLVEFEYEKTDAEGKVVANPSQYIDISADILPALPDESATVDVFMGNDALPHTDAVEVAYTEPERAMDTEEAVAHRN
jgi:hypothetical protein